MIDRVYTSLEYVHAEGFEDTASMLSLWERNWRAYGWKTYVLTSEAARMHPMHDKLMAIVESWPSVNPPGYSRANFRRWLGMVVVAGPGAVLTDFDVMNYGWTPLDATRLFAQHAGHDEMIIADDGAPVPAIGTWEGFERIAKAFMGIDPNHKIFQVGTGPDEQKLLPEFTGRQHVCDMQATRLIAPKRVKVSIEVTLPGWGDAPMVHYGNTRWANCEPVVTGRVNRRRSFGIPGMRPLRVA